MFHSYGVFEKSLFNKNLIYNIVCRAEGNQQGMMKDFRDYKIFYCPLGL